MRSNFQRIEAFLNGLDKLNMKPFGCYYKFDSLKQLVFTFPHCEDENKANIDAFLVYLQPLFDKHLPECRVQSVFPNENVYCTPLMIMFPEIKRRKTPEEKYMKRPDHCPYCKRKDITDMPGMIYSEGRKLHQRIKCNKCGKEWTDHYTLTGVSLRNNNA